MLVEPLPVAGIAREMGVARQSVQRIADLLVAQGHAEYLDNPGHRRAKLVRPTDAGRAALDRIRPLHAQAAAELAQTDGPRRTRRGGRRPARRCRSALDLMGTST